MSTIDDEPLRTYMTDTYGFDDKDFVFDKAAVISDMKDNRSQALYDAYNNDTEVVQADTTDANKAYVHGLRQVIDTMTAHMNKKIDTPHKDAIIAEAMQIGNGSAADTKFGYKELVQNIVDVLERYDISSDNNKGNTSKDDTITPPLTPYTFTETDFELLDAQDGTDDDVIAKQDVLDTYIDAFKEANKTNPNVTDAEITYIKGIVKTMLDNSGSVDLDELTGLISQLNLSKTTDITKDITKGSYTFTKTDFQILDIKDGTDDKKITKQDVLDAYIDAFKEANKTNPEVTDAEITYIKGIVKTMFENSGSVDSYELESLISQFDLSKTTDITKGSYAFDRDKDSDILDTLDGTEDDLIAKQDVLDTYIDAFKEANKTNPEVTDAEITYIKGIVKTMFEKGGSVDWVELTGLISQLNLSKTTDITKGSYAFEGDKDLDILDTEDGIDDDVIAKQDVLDAYIDAFKEANKTNPEVTDAEITYIKGIVKTMLDNSGSVDLNELDSLISKLNLSKTTDIAKGSYTFNFDEKSEDYKADFEALDTFKNTQDNDKISKEAIMNYIDAFATEKNLTDNQIKNLKDKATNYYNSDKHISLSEFKKLTREMKKL
jgi:hypothetical protein